MNEQDETPIADEVVLRRIGAMEGTADLTPYDEAAYDRLRQQIIGQVVSTGDPYAHYEIIEIVPPDEPALVTADTLIEFT